MLSMSSKTTHAGEIMQYVLLGMLTGAVVIVATETVLACTE